MNTIGGLPETEALKWDHDTYQRLGQIVFNICSSDSRKRQQGYTDYHAMRNDFTQIMWNAKIAELDEYRRARGFPSIRGIIVKIGEEIVYYKHAIAAPEIPADIPDENDTSWREEVKQKYAPKPVEAEQMSLF